MKHFVLFISVLPAFAAACGSVAAPADGAGIDGLTTAAPVIESVKWTHVVTCTASVASEVVVIITAADADTTLANLSFSGSVTGCSGIITAAAGTLSCPQIAPYDGSVTVTDPENNSDMVNIRIEPCTDGSVP